MTPEIIAAFSGALIAVLGAIFGFAKWMVDKFLNELKPNGGKSLKDQVNRLEARVDEIYNILAQLQIQTAKKPRAKKTDSN